MVCTVLQHIGRPCLAAADGMVTGVNGFLQVETGSQGVNGSSSCTLLIIYLAMMVLMLQTHACLRMCAAMVSVGCYGSLE
jgi:hypothetical protein